MPIHFKLIARMCLFSILALALAACIEESDSSSGGHAPSSIIGMKLVQTITANDGRSTTISVGDTITYQFIDSTTILGAGDNVVPTTSWSYRRTGSNSAHVELIYHGGASYTDEYLTFSSATRGTFETEGMAGSTPGEYSGTFQIYDLDGTVPDDGGGTDDGGGGDTPACETNNTGTLTFWVSWTGATGTVTTTVDGHGSRSSSYHYTGSGPTCGSTETAAMTFTDIPATTHSYNASDGAGVTWTGTVPVITCDCSRVELY